MLDAITNAQLALDRDQISMQAISQNISNMNTPAYKRELAISSGFDEQLAINLAQVTENTDMAHIQEQGTVNQTRRNLDMAISGPGYFQVQTEEGVFYTRRGDFRINEAGELVTSSGALVLGRNGPIHIDDANFTIDRFGSLFSDHQKVDQLSLVNFADNRQLSYVGQSLYKSQEPAQPADNQSHILQGYIEMANVKAVDEMMEMLRVSRHFEATQRVMRMADNLMATAINQLGEGNV